jgi:hypothetical protein
MQMLVLTALAIILTACSAPPDITVGEDPSDPAAPVPSIRYVPVTDGTVDLRPAEPRPWRGTNGSVAPQSSENP